MHTTYHTRFLPFLFAFFFLTCSYTTDKDLMTQAEQAVKTKKIDEAIRLYERVVTEFKDGKYAAEAMFRMGGLYLGEQKKPLQAIAVYRELAEKYTPSEYAHKGLFIAGFTYANELKNYPEAKKVYEEYLTKFPDSSMAKTARFELANLGKSPDEILNRLQDTTKDKMASRPGMHL